MEVPEGITSLQSIGNQIRFRPQLTPSSESYEKGRNGKFILVNFPGAPMP